MPIITVSGRSGSGKDALVRRLMADLPKAQKLRSYTTREPRLGERNSGYTHVGEIEFETLRHSGVLLWHPGAFGNRYGTHQDDARKALAEGLHFANLFPWNVSELHEYAVRSGQKRLMRSIYIRTPDEAELRRRMLGRGDLPAKVEARITEDRHWDKLAESDANRYLFLNALAPLDEKVAKAIEWIKGDIQASFFRRTMPYKLPLPS